MYRGINEKAAENGVLSTAPQTRGHRRFKLVFGLLRQAWTLLSLRNACILSMTHNMYGILFPFAHRPYFFTRPLFLSLDIYFLSRRTQAFNYERNIVAIPHYFSSLTLDGSREPRRDLDRTGEISKD
jgi:hypothetical protein